MAEARYCIVCGGVFVPADVDAAFCPSCGGPDKAGQETLVESAGQPTLDPDGAETVVEREGVETLVEPEGGQTLVEPAPAGPASVPDDDVPLEWPVGSVVLGTYRAGPVFEGNMGRVQQVRHLGWEVDLAVKTPKAELLARQGGAEAFVEEAQAWIDLGLHPHIVSCFYVRTLGGVPRVFAEWVDGGSLAEAVDTGRLYATDHPLAGVLDVAVQCAWGLAYAHECGLVHQDVKPANVMLTAAGQAQVTDFGLARAAIAPAEQRLGGSGTVLAPSGGYTPAFASPEQLEGAATLTRRSDVYSFGLSVVAMLAGGCDWELSIVGAGRLDQLASGERTCPVGALPTKLTALLAHCLARDEDARPQTMVAVADQLARIYEQHAGVPYPRTRPEAAEMLAASLNNKALSLLDLGRAEDAERAWEAALDSDPHHPESVYHLALARWRAARSDDLTAVAGLAEVCRVRPGKWLPHYLLACVHLERDDCQAALDALDAVPAADSERPEIIVLREQAERRQPGSARLLRRFGGYISIDRAALKGHKIGVESVCLSGDGRYALSGSSDNTLKLWEVATGTCLRTFKGHTGSVESVCLSGDGRYALSGSLDETLKLWEVATGTCLRTFEGHTNAVRSVCLSGDGRYALSGSFDHTLKLWEVATGTCLRTFVGHTSRVESVCLSGDGRYALSGSLDETLKLWEVATGTCLRTFEGHTGLVSSVCLSGDGRHALSGSRPGDGREYHFLRLWEVAPTAGRFTAPVEVSAIVTAEAALERERESRDLLGRAAQCRDRGDHGEALRHLRQARVLPDYDRHPQLLAAWVGLYARLPRRGLRAGFHLSTFKGHTDAVWSVCLSGDGRFALSGSDDHTLKLWDVATGTCVRTLKGHTQWVRSVCLSADGRHALSGSSDHTLKLWEVATGTCVRTFEGHTSRVRSVCLSADGRHALSGSSDKTLKLWDVATGACLSTLKVDTQWVQSVCLSADGRHALSGNDDHTLELWKLANEKRLRSFEGHTGGVFSVCLSGDGRHALSGSLDHTLKLWDVATGTCVRTFKGHTDAVRSVCLSADGRHALSGSSDKTLKLWDVATGRCLRTFEGHEWDVRSVSLSADGRHALSGSDDRTLRLWFLDWELEERKPANWDDGALPYVEAFLRLHTPESAGLLRRGQRPSWTEEDFGRLLHTLGCAGYGWLRPEGVRRKLEALAGR